MAITTFTSNACRAALLLSIFAIAVLWLISPAQAARHDQVGNLYPEQCQGDLSWVDVPVVYVSPDMLGRRGGRVLELYVPGVQPMILIDSTLPDWRKEDALQHSRCHHLLGAWHK